MELELAYQAIDCGRHSGNHCLRDLYWPELLWAAVSVGKRSHRDWENFTQFSTHEVMFRLHLIQMSLMNRQGIVSKTPLYAEGLDPSEKSAISYFLGLTAAKLFAERFFGVPWLMHLDLCTDLDIVWQGSNSRIRPDLVGLTRNGAWLVAEAKGRSGIFCRKAFDRALDQTEQILTINGQPPRYKVALQAYFISHGQDEHWKVYMEDPEKADDQAKHLKIDLKRFFCEYYYHIVNLFVDYRFDSHKKLKLIERPDGEFIFTQEIRDATYKLRRFHSLGVNIGLNERILNYYITDFSTSSDIHINLFIDDLKNHQKHDKKDIHDEHLFIGPDGIVVQVEKQWYAWQAHLEKVISQNGEDNGCFR